MAEARLAALLQLRIAVGLAAAPAPAPTPSPLAFYDVAAAALLFLRAAPRAPIAVPAAASEAQKEAAELFTWNSEHTCAAFMYAAVSLLREGAASRYAGGARVPSVYLALDLNIESTEKGRFTSVEVCEEQAECAADALAPGNDGRDVRFALDSVAVARHQMFFIREFLMRAGYELYNADGDFARNVYAATVKRRRGETAYSMYGLWPTTLDGFAAKACTTRGAGVLIVFRQGPKHAQPFGIWLIFLVDASGKVAVIDVQNSTVSASAGEAIGKLGWHEPPRKEVFYARMR
jgi:hypothetical protein